MGNDTTVFCCFPTAKIKTHTKTAWEYMITEGVQAAQNWQAIYPTEYRCFIKEVSIMRSGCGNPIAENFFSFVCQTTPHYGSTSREGSYSVRSLLYTHRKKK